MKSKNDWEYVKVKGNKKIIMKKINGKLKQIGIEEVTPVKVNWLKHKGGKK